METTRHEEKVQAFTLYWRTGHREVVYGVHAADAMSRAGYGRGALPALDFWATGVDTDYSWDAERREWKDRTTTS